jgi:CheY-like chemotaxis protein
VVPILVVDDEPDMLLIVRTYLERAGLNVVGEARDGREALDMYHGLNPPPVPSVVVLDNQMPGLTGLDVAAEILAEFPGQPVVLFSAYLDDEIIDRATRQGVTACVSKSDVAKLADIVKGLTPGPVEHE